MLDLVRRIYPDVPAVFVDTGLEYPEIREFVKTIDNVTWLKPEMSFRKVIETYGYPLISKEVAQKIEEYRKHPDGCRAKYFDDNSEYNKKYNGRFSCARWTWLRDSDIPISKKCCEIMKKKPAKKYERETKRHPYLGSMACESDLRLSNWIAHGCNAFDVARPMSTPMAFWNEGDVLEYIAKNNLPYASCYGDIVLQDGKYSTTGCDRTGCIWCMFGLHLEKEPTRLQRLHESHPQLWEYCLRPWDEGGLGMKDVIDKMNASGKLKHQIKYE